MTDRSLMASNVGVALGTLASRITGLARVVLFAAVIGQTALADAFDVGNNTPNVVYELLLGGTLAAALIPLFTQHHHRSDRQATAAVMGTALMGALALTVIAVVAAPLIFRLYALSPAGDAELFYRVGTALTRIFLVQVFFYALNALVAALLNARGRFFAAAWAPVASNAVACAALVAVWSAHSGGAVDLADADLGTSIFWWFSLGPTLGIAAMAGIVLAAGVRAGEVPLPSLHFSHPAVRELLSISGWAVGYIAANQVALVVVKNLAQPGSGQLDAYAKAMTVFQLPHGLLAVTVATTAMPLLARAVADNDRALFAQRFAAGARTTVMLTLPCSIALVLFAQPLVRLVLGWGSFSDDAVRLTAEALSGLSVGLVGFSLYLFALRGFYSHGDTRTPFLINVGENALNIVLAFALVDRYGVHGLGLAFSIAYLVSAVVAVTALRRMHGTPGLFGLLRARA
ncbi:MAG: hypothetical protein RLZZ284_1398 [Actinomycetota bacterium]